MSPRRVTVFGVHFIFATRARGKFYVRQSGPERSPGIRANPRSNETGQVADAYTNNLFYIGTRATGGKGGNHAFVGPDWKGTLPKDVIEHRVPTNTVIFAIRIGVGPATE